MKNIVLLFITAFFVQGCDKSVVKEPKNLIEQETMIEILYDISVLEAIKVSNPESLIKRNINASTYIYKKYKIDSTQYAQSDKFYASDVKNYHDMFNTVIEKLNDQKKQDSLANLPKKRKRKPKS